MGPAKLSGAKNSFRSQDLALFYLRAPPLPTTAGGGVRSPSEKIYNTDFCFWKVLTDFSALPQDSGDALSTAQAAGAVGSRILGSKARRCLSADLAAGAKIRDQPMPLVRIDLRKGKQAAYREAISRIVREALVSVGVPKDDRFHVISEHDSGNLIFDPNYLDI